MFSKMLVLLKYLVSAFSSTQAMLFLINNSEAIRAFKNISLILGQTCALIYILQISVKLSSAVSVACFLVYSFLPISFLFLLYWNNYFLLR